MSITLSEEGATIGRRENNSLVLPDPKRFISGRHAIIDYQAPDYFITDTSTNGVLINQSPTPFGNGNSTKLNDGDLLILGDYTLRIEITDATEIIEEHELNLEFAEPLSAKPSADEADESLDFFTDPFGEVDADPVHKMIDENELIPSEWHDGQEPIPGPFDIHTEELPSTDFDHFHPQKEAFQPVQGKTDAPSTDQEQLPEPDDIFADDWFLKKEDEKTDQLEPEDESELIHPKSDFDQQHRQTEPASPPHIFPPETVDHTFIKPHPKLSASEKFGSPDWRTTLKEELERIPIGQVMFNPPSTMQLGVTDRVEVRITQDPDVDLTTALKGRGFPKIEKIKTSALMKVRLTGNAFSIQSLNEEKQIVYGSEYTEWAWDVKPVKSGKQALNLHITLRIWLPIIGEEKKDYPVMDRNIIVSINPVYNVKQFIATNWKWITGALLLPFLGWVWQTYFQV